MANLRLAEQGQFDLQKVPDFNSEVPITYTVPGALEKGNGINLPDKTITKNTKLSDLFNQSF